LSFFFSSRRRHTRFSRDWSSDVCSSDLDGEAALFGQQKEALLMLLEARMLLTKMVRWRWIKEQNEIEERRKKTQEEKKKRGKLRSEERRVGKECRAGGAPHREKRNRKRG